jgi:hypothetical protein
LQDVASEWKQLRYDPPSYLEHLQDIFEGVAVDGTSSYVPGQPEQHDAEEDDGPHHFDFPTDETPRSTGSNKRGSSTSTTGASPSKKSKSVYFNMFRSMVQQNSEVSGTKLQMMKERQAEKKMKEQQETTQHEAAIQWGLEAGIEPGSPEFLALGYLCERPIMMRLFFKCQTPEQRIAFIRRYMKAENLD